MLGLAVGTDYSLFIISRHLRLLEEGAEPNESIARTIASSGSAVVFAAVMVIIALLCLYFSGIPLVRSLGYTTAIVVASALLAAITLLPAILGLLGRRIQAFPLIRKVKEGDGDHKGGWERWSETIRNHPLISSGIGIVILALLAIPATSTCTWAPRTTASCRPIRPSGRPTTRSPRASASAPTGRC